MAKAGMAGGQVKVTVRFESDPCEQGTFAARQQQVELLRQLVGNVELMNCGYAPFQKLTMKHTGEYWLIEMEAVATE